MIQHTIIINTNLTDWIINSVQMDSFANFVSVKNTM